MTSDERSTVPATVPLWFDCGQETLCGLLDPAVGAVGSTGVVILVGGPQYKVGSHRQFVLLARGLAERGIPTFRFDCRGMGDSSGEFPGFEALDEDIAAAVSAFVSASPGVQQVILWGLCDGASAAAFYAYQDERIRGLCLANPWVRTEQGEAAAVMKHYYLTRILSLDFWRKLLSGGVQLTASLGDLLRNARQALAGRVEQPSQTPIEQLPLPDRLFASLARYSDPVALFISGQDLTASEFMAAAKGNAERKRWLAAHQVTLLEITEADHTFSRRVWMDRLIQQTADWIAALSANRPENGEA